MADELNDSELRARRQKGMALTLADLFTQLRVSGLSEIASIVLYCLLTLLLIVYFLSWRSERHFHDFGYASAVMISALHLLVVLWLSKRLFARRQHYFTLLRAIRRAQNYFRVADHDFTFFPSEMRNAAFPEGYGDQDVRAFNKTTPWGWYYRRHFWLIGLNLLLVHDVFLCTRSASSSGPLLAVGFVHVIAMATWFGFDWRFMVNRIDEERGLVGANESDYPPRETKPSP